MQEIFPLGKLNEMTKLVLTPNAKQVFHKHSAELTRVRVVAPIEHGPYRRAPASPILLHKGIGSETV